MERKLIRPIFSTNAFKRYRTIMKMMEKNELSPAWLETNFDLSVGDLKQIIEEL